MDTLWGVLDVGFLPVGWGRDGLIGERGYLNVEARGGGCSLCLMRKEIYLVVKFTVIWASTGEGKSFPASGKGERRIWRVADAMPPRTCFPHGTSASRTPGTAKAAININMIWNGMVILKKTMAFCSTKCSFASFGLFPLPQCRAAINARLSYGAGIIISNPVYSTECWAASLEKMHPDLFCKAIIWG